MSGYLEVKYPFKSNLGLNPFKSWKRQWCILRPSPTCSGGSLAVYCSEAGAAAGTVELPAGCVVRRAKSRTRPYAFAVFAVDDRKPRVLLAAQSLPEAQSWMDKIRALLNGDKQLGTDMSLKDSYSVTVIPTELSTKCGLNGDGVLALSSKGVVFSKAQKHGTFIEWKHITDVQMCSEDKNRICIITIDGSFSRGAGAVRLQAPGADVAAALRAARGPARGALSRSDGDLRAQHHIDEVRRTSWYSGPSDVSLDDLDLIVSKEWQRLPRGPLSRCAGAGHLAPPRVHHSMSDRRSLLSIASGIYEEIPDLPHPPDTSHTPDTPDTPDIPHTPDTPDTPNSPPADTYCHMGGDTIDGVMKRPGRREEPTYECVSECVYATVRRPRRAPPPPLPPRLPFGSSKLGMWNSVNCDPVTRHSSLGSLPRCCSVSAPNKNKTFSVFRKRLKSDSRIASSPKSDTSKENKDVETKKKKFDFTPTRDIFKNFKVSRKMKNLKITNGSLSKGETKSCEFLDETEHVTTNRCSKSVECLEDNNEFLDEFDGDLSIEFNDDAVAALALPKEIVDVILQQRSINDQLTKMLKDRIAESEYMPMSPVIPAAPIEHHYIVMSPKTNLA
ncbi:uncharacterized protein LOC126374339 [Pectinophora gossypiella]|nr:uncharacterized protein LOC126374339 [Pectinophora gossypiella]